MKKRNLLGILILVMAVIFGACSINTASSSADNSTAGGVDPTEPIEIKIAHTSSETNMLHIGVLKFKEVAEAESNGRFVVNIFPNGQLASGDEGKADAVKNGVVQLSAVPTYTLGALANISEYGFCDIPYLFDNDQEIYDMFEEDFVQELGDRLLDSTGIKTYIPYTCGWVKIATNKNPIHSPADIKGLKIRTPNTDVYMEMIRSWGANPTPMNYSEVFTALQQGTVDGVIAAGTNFGPDKLAEVTKYMATVNPFPFVHVPIVNNAFYESLPDDLKVVFDHAMEEYVMETRRLHEIADAYVPEEVTALGMDVTVLNDEEFAAFKDASAYIKDQRVDQIGAEFLDKVTAVLEGYRSK